jgi:hypothetical protein
MDQHVSPGAVGNATAIAALAWRDAGRQGAPRLVAATVATPLAGGG